MNEKIKRRLVSAANTVILFIAVWGIDPGAANAESSGLVDAVVLSNQTATTQVVELDSPIAEQLVFYPTDGDRDGLISGFGYRSKACSACSSDHHGSDFSQKYGKKVYAVSYGTVTKVGWESGYGFVIRIRHDEAVGLGDVVTLYAHLADKSNYVKVGDKVTPRQKIAVIGQTGVATVPHLHFEVIVAGNQVDPMPWLKKYRAK